MLPCAQPSPVSAQPFVLVRASPGHPAHPRSCARCLFVSPGLAAPASPPAYLARSLQHYWLIFVSGQRAWSHRWILT
eukprot:2962613-Lingulodinium_polyedra.AAC.1